MPTEERTFETTREHVNFHDLPYLLSDSLPDDFGNLMMKAWLHQRGLSVEDINPVDRLTMANLLTFAREFGIKKANAILEEVFAAVNLWPGIASGLDIPRGTIAYIKRYLRTHLD